MKFRPIHAVVTVLTLGVVSCSSDSNSDDNGNDAIDGIQSGKEIPSEETSSESPEGMPGKDETSRPEIQLPDDMDNVFEEPETGGQHVAILRDVMEGINAIDMAIAESNPGHPAVEFYNVGDALVNAKSYIRGGSDNNRSWTGTAEYYDFTVSTPHPGEASVTYCIDTSGVQTKELDTGQVLPKPQDAQNYNYTQIVLHQNDLGIWQVATVLERDSELDRKCER